MKPLTLTFCLLLTGFALSNPQAVPGFISSAAASGIIPETSVVIVEQDDGEGAINLKNSDSWPLLVVTSVKTPEGGSDELLVVTPPVSRVEPDKVQRVRFMLKNAAAPLRTEYLRRVTFEGIPPQQKGKNELRVTVRQNLPVIVRPAGLPRHEAPWTLLRWTHAGNKLQVENASPYVVRLGQTVQTLPDQANWMLPATYILPGQQVTLHAAAGSRPADHATAVRLSPATSWGYAVNVYDAPLTR